MGQIFDIVMDKLALIWIVGANALAAAILYQRLDKMGYVVPFKHHMEATMERFGLFHASYPQCGLLNDTMFVLTSSRVVHPDGVRPGASEHCEPIYMLKLHLLRCPAP